MSRRRTVKPILMRIDLDEWMRDAATLNALECGALLRIQMHFWMFGTIPSDDERLARIVRTDARTWKKIRDVIKPMFVEQDGEWTRPDWVAARAKRGALHGK